MDELTIPENVDRHLIDAITFIAKYRREVGDVDDALYLIGYLERLLHLINDLIVTAEETLRAIPEPHADQLVDFIDGPVPELARNLSQLRTSLEGAAFAALEREGDVTLPDGRRAYPTYKKAKVQTDGERLLSLLVARCADLWQETATPHEFADLIGRKVAGCSGVTNASHAWRKTALAKEHINLADFQTSEQGAPTVRFTAPALAKPVPEDKADEAA